MQARLWTSGRFFECAVERIEPSAGAWIVKTRARRYFRLDTASVALLRQLMAPEAPDLAAPEHATALSFLQQRLIPLGIYTPLGEAPEAPRPQSSHGAMRWQRQLLPARHVQPVAAALATLFSASLLWPLMALCLWVLVEYAQHGAAQIAYRDLISVTPRELALLVLVALVRGLLHEFGHAAACWRFTRSVGPIGFGVFMTTPVLYCDVSDIHLLPRRAKALVGLAGTAMDVMCLALLVSVAGADPTVMKIFWLSSLAVLLNLLPFYRNDGYWVMNDLAGTDDLLKLSLQAMKAGTARPRDALLLGFMAACVMGMAALAVVFASEVGPMQVAEALRLLPSFEGLVLALVTALQYTALVFGLLSAARLLLRRP